MLNFKCSEVIKTTKNHLKKLDKLSVFSVQDLLEFFPRALESTEINAGMHEIVLDQKNTLGGVLLNFTAQKTRHGKKLGKGSFELADGTVLDVIWFQMPYALKNISLPRDLFLVGKVERKYGKLQIINPEIHKEAGIHVGGIRPIYPESPPITSKWLREKVHPLLRFTSEFKEVLPEKVVLAEGLMSKSAAIKKIHFPDSPEEWKEARRRLGFEEIFLIQSRVIQAKLEREKQHENPYPISFSPEAVKEDLKKLPFELTTHQKKSLLDVLEDCGKDRPMHRLLQGDVGSGKTIVGLLGVLQAMRQGYQGALLAPTEILAAQHYESAMKFLGLFDDWQSEGTADLFGEKSSSDIALLTGSMTEKQKKETREKLRTGAIKFIIGTHAILTETTVFKNLGFAIIDEQHRFGVKQRAFLSEAQSHTLSMTATPIPRSLALTIYGDQDLSIIREKPAGRKDIITRVIADPKTETLCYRFIEDQIKKGRQVFWVCPLVDESDKIEAKNVKDTFEHVKLDLFPNHRVDFLHGKMRPKEKEEVMNRFKNHEFDVLVSTSVIEVGVDIPNSTVMVIENSERFGLAQLHQFRGRIGRNDMQSYCFLKVGKPDDKNKARLSAMVESNDGFYLSEVDLKLRGAGEVYGLRQSGLPDLKCADLGDVELMQTARDWAQKILSEDLELTNYPNLKTAMSRGEVWF